ncbi:hypothetical protein NLJ89_g7117 [Agrocybe chaxingu]|uniref:pyranose dehydrogenase (acceptor) n=1 Tax=Agrocybe chaxingu TaxID=84603 RepID=A0A9W8MU01_9AGAR|nr:hypothetical protein NLJ89_g7117 [Agrocybe chaxingu]
MCLSYKLAVIQILSLLQSSAAALLSRRDLPHVVSTNYDFVIVGGGTAGNVVANRLTENSNFSVLVLEAGPRLVKLYELLGRSIHHSQLQRCWGFGSPSPIPAPYRGSSDPLGLELHHSGPARTEWSLSRSPSWSCARWNEFYGMVYARGSKADFDRYANFTGDEGWSWDNMLPYFKKGEKFTPPPDRHNTTGQFDPSVHGFDGLTSVSLPGAPTVLDGRFEVAIDQLGGEFTHNLDVNSGSPLGFGWVQATIDGPSASRSSSSSGYLAREFLLRPNLHVLVNAQVSRVISEGNQDGVPEFKTVEFRLNGGGSLFTASASKEVILSAGTINTPQVLMNSGIGSPSHLNSHGIQSIVDLPDVGENLFDHPLITLYWRVNSNRTYDDYRRSSALQDEALQTWKDTRQGVYATGVSQHVGFVRIPSNNTIFANAPNPASGPGSPHFEMFLSNFRLGPTPPEGNYLSISALLSSPGNNARGSVKLNSSDPFSIPLIDTGLLADNATDLALMREAVKSVLRFVSAPAWEDYILGPEDSTQPGLNATDVELDTFIRANTRAGYHIVGTSSMTRKGAEAGVVDPDLKLKKAAGLRIVDASVLPLSGSNLTVTGQHKLPLQLVKDIADSNVFVLRSYVSPLERTRRRSTNPTNSLSTPARKPSRYSKEKSPKTTEACNDTKTPVEGVNEGIALDLSNERLRDNPSVKPANKKAKKGQGFPQEENQLVMDDDDSSTKKTKPKDDEEENSEALRCFLLEPNAMHKYCNKPGARLFLVVEEKEYALVAEFPVLNDVE